MTTWVLISLTRPSAHLWDNSGYRQQVSLDVAQLRADTPGCEEIIHLNNAGAALSPRSVTNAVTDHLRLESQLGGYEAAEAAADKLIHTRSSIAQLLSVDAADIALTHSDTSAWTKAFWGLALAGWFSSGGTVLVDSGVYNSHYFALLQAQQLFDLQIELMQLNEDGSLNLDDLDSRLDSCTKMVTATHVGTHKGAVFDVAQIGARTRALGIPFFLDACQSAGQLPLNLASIQCDVATGTGRKFLRGPRGTGWLFVREEWAERMQPPGIDGSSATWTSLGSFELLPRAERFQEFEYPIAAQIGLGVAVSYALELGIEAIANRISGLSAKLRTGLQQAGAKVHDGPGPQSGIVSFTLPNVDCDYLAGQLKLAGINLSVTRAAWTRFDMGQRGLEAAVRASPHAYNTETEIDYLVGQVASQ